MGTRTMTDDPTCSNCSGNHTKSFSMLRWLDQDLDKWAPTVTGWEADMYRCTECDGYERARQEWFARQRAKRESR